MLHPRTIGMPPIDPAGGGNFSIISNPDSPSTIRVIGLIVGSGVAVITGYVLYRAIREWCRNPESRRPYWLGSNFWTSEDEDRRGRKRYSDDESSGEQIPMSSLARVRTPDSTDEENPAPPMPPFTVIADVHQPMSPTASSAEESSRVLSSRAFSRVSSSRESYGSMLSRQQPSEQSRPPSEQCRRYSFESLTGRGSPASRYRSSAREPPSEEIYEVVEFRSRLPRPPAPSPTQLRFLMSPGDRWVSAPRVASRLPRPTLYRTPSTQGLSSSSLFSPEHRSRTSSLRGPSSSLFSPEHLSKTSSPRGPSSSLFSPEHRSKTSSPAARRPKTVLSARALMETKYEMAAGTSSPQGSPSRRMSLEQQSRTPPSSAGRLPKTLSSTHALAEMRDEQAAGTSSTSRYRSEDIVEVLKESVV